jgi:hypothetical protein
MIAAHQLGLGQLPLGLFFADKLKLREDLTEGLKFMQILKFEEALPRIDLSVWKYGPFASNLFNKWWQEWAQQLFYQLVIPYCLTLNPNFPFDAEVSKLSCR